MIPLTVRIAAPEDEQDVVALWHACGLVVRYNDPHANFRFAQSHVNSAVLLGEDDAGRIVASVMTGHDGHRGWLYYVGTDPDWRDQGVGARLVAAAENWLRKRGVVKAQLMVRDTNAGVASFYQQLGYEVAPRILMAKWLNGDS